MAAAARERSYDNKDDGTSMTRTGYTPVSCSSARFYKQRSMALSLRIAIIGLSVAIWVAIRRQAT